MRGINYAHTWYKGDAETAIPAIAATGANVIRIVLSDGDQYTFMPVFSFQVHDATGSDDFAKLRRAADYWISLASTLKGLEDHVIINIANEWFGSSGQLKSNKNKVG
ncbi:hypothetical protein FOCC_FOCC008714 [Frankliniella occidentalis]|nr:hypothetical protein FOCC_FOCC008714 [Frankliniella occidentalis]